MSRVTERFLTYVKFDTQSDPKSNTCPSTAKQLELARYLVKELKSLGLEDVTLDEYGYVMATLKGNVDRKVPTVGFIAHMDTSDAMSGADVKPKIVTFTGEDIVLNEELDIVLSPKDFPSLYNYLNEAIIVTDGTTLLGADDKAGIAEIVTAVEYLLEHPEIPHGDIKIAFTPDEEIGRGADQFDVKRFGADFAYTVDGGAIGELQYESFNAAAAEIRIKGRSVHPGDAKGKMINAIHIANEIAMMFPADERPETTEGYEGFYHLYAMSGTVEEASMEYIIREFDAEKFKQRKNFVVQVIKQINQKYPDAVELILYDQYYNMRDKLEERLDIVEYAKQAMMELGIEPVIKPIRGGTDGSKLSYMGLPTPNLFTGGHNFHGKCEYIPIRSMEKAVQVIVKICELVAR
ncbi:MAG TPA: peptidase T [Haloplasmataceae bacterium]